MKPPHRVGPYRLVKLIGQGTMGRVYEGRDPGNQPVAVKLLAVEGMILNRHEHDLDTEWEYLERFFKEIVVLALLSKHTNGSPRYLDHGVTIDGVHYLVMELINGETLEYHLERHSVNTEDALRIILHTLQTLEPAHALGIVHRDLKPANIMLTLDRGVRVIDFGITRAFYGRTNPRFVVGNLQHMSPEQANRTSSIFANTRQTPITPASDVFALGSILYTLLTGHNFFAGKTADEVLKARKRTRIANHPEVNCNIPSSLWNILYRSLQHEPGKRMSAAAMRELIEAELRTLAVTNDPLRKSSVTSRYPNRPANDGVAATLREHIK